MLLLKYDLRKLCERKFLDILQVRIKMHQYSRL